MDFDIDDFFQTQLAQWPDFRTRYEQLKSEVKVKSFNIGGVNIKTQCNPARIVSSGAKVDKNSIAKRKCFLCAENRPKEQFGYPILDDFTLLVNPFPILDRHFTIVCNQHSRQEFLPHIEDVMKLSELMPDYMLFYNGPMCGASAPDHMHIQAVREGQLPLELDLSLLQKKEILHDSNVRIFELLNFLRKCIVFEGSDVNSVINQFKSFISTLNIIEDAYEPMYNAFVNYKSSVYRIYLFPRKAHRPSQYYAEGESQMMISPGAIDMGGVLVLPKMQDFERTDETLIKDVYQQVSL